MREEGALRLRIKFMPSFGSLQGSLRCPNSGGVRGPRGKVTCQWHSAGSGQAVGLSRSEGSDHRGTWNKSTSGNTLTAPEGKEASARVRPGPVIGSCDPRSSDRTSGTGIPQLPNC